MAKNNDNEELSANLDDADSEELKQLREEEERIAKQVQAEVSQELTAHITKLEMDLKDAFNQRMAAMAEQRSQLEADQMSQRQIDILRVNKVFRDITRPLGANWRPVFERLMSRFPSDVVDAECSKIEQDRPVLQPYKALMTWKDACGQDFNIRDLIEALRQSGQDDLANVVLQILDSNEKDSLIELTGFGKGLSGGAAKSGGVSRAAAAAAVGKPSSSTSASTNPQSPAVRSSGGSELSSKNSAPSKKIDPDEVLDDRHLLQVAKRVGAAWEPLAKALNFPSDEMAEVIESEGKTYQGGFRMLWSWRESSSVSMQTLESLTAALKELGHQDIIDQVLH